MLQHEQSSSRSLPSVSHASCHLPLLLCCFLVRSSRPAWDREDVLAGLGWGVPFGVAPTCSLEGWVLAPWWQALLGMCSPAGYSGWLGTSLSWSALALRGSFKGLGLRPAVGAGLQKQVRVATGLQRNLAAVPAVGTGDQVVLLLLSSLA